MKLHLSSFRAQGQELKGRAHRLATVVKRSFFFIGQKVKPFKGFKILLKYGGIRSKARKTCRG